MIPNNTFRNIKGNRKSALVHWKILGQNPLMIAKMSGHQFNEKEDGFIPTHH